MLQGGWVDAVAAPAVGDPPLFRGCKCGMTCNSHFLCLVHLWRLIHPWKFLVVWALEVFQNRYSVVDETRSFLWNYLSYVSVNVETYYILLLKCSKNSDFIYSLNCCPLKPLWSRLKSNGDGWKGWSAERAPGTEEGIRTLQCIKNNQV